VIQMKKKGKKKSKRRVPKTRSTHAPGRPYPGRRS
jgi:hypothetical protein